MLDLDQMNELIAAGFRLDADLLGAHREAAETKGLNVTGPYVVDAAYRKGLVTLVFECNTSVDTDSSGQSVTVKYAPVCVVEGPGGRVACAAKDTELITRMAEELA